MAYAHAFPTAQSHLFQRAYILGQKNHKTRISYLSSSLSPIRFLTLIQADKYPNYRQVFACQCGHLRLNFLVRFQYAAK